MIALLVFEIQDFDFYATPFIFLLLLGLKIIQVQNRIKRCTRKRTGMTALYYPTKDLSKIIMGITPTGVKIKFRILEKISLTETQSFNSPL